MGGAGWDSKEQSGGKGLLAKGSGPWGVAGGWGEGRRGRPTPVASSALGRTRPVLGDSLYQ